MIKYEQIYRNQPICKLENIIPNHYKKVKKMVLYIFNFNSFVENDLLEKIFCV